MIFAGILAGSALLAGRPLVAAILAALSFALS